MNAPKHYRIMQYNVLHQRAGWGEDVYLNLGLKTRSENVEKAIRDCSPDILVLAERHDEWAGIPVDYSDVSVDLGRMLDDAYCIAEDRIENGLTVNRTPILYKKDVFRCVESGSYELGEEMSFSVSQNKRVVSYAVLEDISNTQSNGLRIVVFSTHWSSGQPQSLTNQQSESMQNVMRTVLSQKDYSLLPVVAAADYNVQYSNEAYQLLLSGCGLSDADYSVRKDSLMDQTIVDHIAVAGCTAERFMKYAADYTQQASDHKPIVCDIKIGG